MTTTPDIIRFLTPPAVAKRLGVTPERVISWIRAGRLRAVNLSDGPIRPRYRVAPDDLERFLTSREVSPRPRPVRRRCEPTVKHYFRGGDER